MRDGSRDDRRDTARRVDNELILDLLRPVQSIVLDLGNIDSLPLLFADIGGSGLAVQV